MLSLVLIDGDATEIKAFGQDGTELRIQHAVHTSITSASIRNSDPNLLVNMHLRSAMWEFHLLEHSHDIVRFSLHADGSAPPEADECYRVTGLSNGKTFRVAHWPGVGTLPSGWFIKADESPWAAEWWQNQRFKTLQQAMTFGCSIV